MSLCYITIQSHTYVILNLYIYSLTYAPKIFVVQCNRCNVSRTYSFGLGEYVWAYLCHSNPTRALTRARIGGGSLHMCSFYPLGSMPYRLRRILNW